MPPPPPEAMEATFDLPIMSPAGGRPDTDLFPRQAAPAPYRSPFPPRAPAAADSRFKRGPPQRPGRDGERVAPAVGTSVGRPKTRMSPTNAFQRSLLPVSERRSQEENKLDLRARRDAEHDRIDITPDGGSAGREGRQFAVANVGNNGRIYLKPTVRPAHQRYPQPPFVFPMTPPGTATVDASASAAATAKAAAVAATPEKAKDRRIPEDILTPDTSQLLGQWTPTYAPATPTTARKLYYDSRFSSKRGHRRAVSDSTIPDTSARESEAGGFKIVITQPGEDQRPRTGEDAPDTDRAPVLDIAIPSWKLGTPRFTLLGTPIIRGSSFGAPTEDLLSSGTPSVFNRTPRVQTPGLEPGKSKKPAPISIPQVTLHQLDITTPPTAFSPHLPPPMRSTYLSTHLVIQPSMFDDLTFKPACDDRALVRYSPATGAVTAATPPRLVAEITSPSFLDYELLSDFFLTFRAFLESIDLLRMLIARLRWALARSDEIGTVVRVRTFVALRHWILNYFMDDFVVDYNLRVVFCNLLNDFVDELSSEGVGRKVQIKILAELKKCWRRVCGQYWDGPEFDASLAPEIPIAPGGIAGHRSGSLDPSFWEKQGDEAQTPHLDGIFAQLGDPAGVAGGTSFYADVSRAGHIDTILNDDRPASPEPVGRPPPAGLKRTHAASPLSVSSIDVISCSFPSKNFPPTQPGTEVPLAAHPVDPSSVFTYNMDPIATTPRALTGKRVRPQQAQHKRNGSLTDSLREHATATEKLIWKNTELLMSLPYAGSLVRGAMFPPGQAFVEVQAPSSAGGPSRQTTVFQPHPLESQKEKGSASAMSGQGMRKLLGSVRRALSTRGQVVSPTQGNFINISPLGPRGATTNRLPGTAIVPQARPRQNGVRPPIRIDILGAEVAEDFKKAIREDEAAEATRNGYMLPNLGEDEDGDGDISVGAYPHSTGHLDSSLQVHHPDDSLLRPISDAAITTGSKSIVIVDDTLPLDFPVMTGALPAVNLSVEAFAESLLPSGADPTPPNTPPGLGLGTPRRSSYVLRQHILRHSHHSEDSMPHFPPAPALSAVGSSDIAGRPSQDTTRPSVDVVRPSLDYTWQSSSRPPLSGVRGHFRQRSSRSYRSMQSSYGRRRYASFTSGIAPQPTVRSFDATTTYSEGSVDDAGNAAVPQPLRVLRRRPGGDLRAATNVGDLDHHPLRRSRSVGSLTTYSDSMRSSYIRSPVQDSTGFVDVVSSEYSRERAATFSLGAIAEQHPKQQQLSLFSTHSSKPVMRPSFEAEAQKLAQIPDDVDDDGGVESALLKLEGKFEKKTRKLSMEPTGPVQLDVLDGVEVEGDEGLLHRSASKSEKRTHRHQHIDEGTHLAQILGHDAAAIDAIDGVDPDADPDAGVVEHEGHEGHRYESLLQPPRSTLNPDGEVLSFLSEGSGESYSSIPLLDRDPDDPPPRRRKKATTREWTDRSVLQDEDAPTPNAAETPSPRDSQHPSYDFVKKTPSLEKIRPGDTMPGDAQPDAASNDEQSFLDDDSDAGSDLSSELSVDILGDDHVHEAGSPYVPNRERSGTVVSRLPAHPLGDPMDADPALRPQPLRSHPPSPPMTLVQALAMSPETANIPRMHEHQIWGEKPLPPTPETTPTTAANGQHGAGAVDAAGMGLESPRDPTGTREALLNAPAPTMSEDSAAAAVPSKFSVHLPFILAFDSEILAQQFTLIEKDALNEIDWKELIDMRWKNAGQNGSNSRSWVDFLRNTDARGVEVVIARFNIMVKWCISEVVLTQDLEERARCVIKFVHIAAHCRRYRNFATMSQVAIALTSPEISRLAKTWAMVPPSDMATVRDLEALVSPTRNFYNLRAEMEGGGIASAETGCIPFVGIYTHDLLFNAQRPSEIASSPTTAPLVNFERCRCAAGVIKTLLRLLEASTLYAFQPIEGITERCLWMGALGDEEIRRLSERLE